MKTVDVLMRGIGQGRESAVRGLANAGLVVQSITLQLYIRRESGFDR